MSLENHKITTYADNVKDLPDYPSDAGYTAKQLKEIFDGRTDKEIKEKFNALIDELKEIIEVLEAADRSAEEEAKKYTDTEVAGHNSSASAHSDIRNLMSELTRRLNAVADSDDTTLDQISELVAYIKDNRELIEVITTQKANASDVYKRSNIDTMLNELEERLKKLIVSGGGGNGAILISVHDELYKEIIPEDGQLYVVKYHDMPAWAQENDANGTKVPVTTDTIRYRFRIGDGITPLCDLTNVSNIQAGEGNGSIIQIDPTYDGGDDREGAPNEATGQLSAALGKYNKVPGKASMAINYANIVEAARALAAGVENHIEASATAAFVAGIYNIVRNAYQASFGRYNNPDDPDALFTIGVGTSDSKRKNGLTVCKGGIIKFNEKVFDVTKTEEAVEFANELKNAGASAETVQFVNELKALTLTALRPSSLMVDIYGNLTLVPFASEETIQQLKIYKNGHSDLTSGVLTNYLEYPAEDSGSDRQWAFIGTVSVESSSAGVFASFGNDFASIPKVPSDGWTAFKVKILKSGDYVISGTYGQYKSAANMEMYVIPMTDTIAAELAPDNTDTYGIESNAGSEKYPKMLKREGYKTFSDLSFTRDLIPLGDIIEAKVSDATTVTLTTDRFGTTHMDAGEYVLLFRNVGANKQSTYLANITFTKFDPFTDAIKVGDTVLTEGELIAMKASSGTADLSGLVTANELDEAINGITPAGIGASPSGHMHDERYYSKEETDALVNSGIARWKCIADVTMTSGANGGVVSLSSDLRGYQEARVIVHIGDTNQKPRVHAFVGGSASGVYLGGCSVEKDRYGTIVIPSIYEVGENKHLLSIDDAYWSGATGFSNHTGGTLVTTAVNSLYVSAQDSGTFGTGGRVIVIAR